MLTTKYNSKGYLFYIAYFYIICLYLIFLRLKAVPNTLNDLLYGLCIALSIFYLSKDGLKKLSRRQDVQSLLLFCGYYLLSSFIYLGLGESGGMSWIFKDWLYSLLPILFYILVRLTKNKLNHQLILKIILISVLIYDILALLMLLFPGSFIVRLFNQEMIVSASVVYALHGILGSIIGGFCNVLALSICVFSPINVRSIYRVILSVFFVICIFMIGQRTPIGGVAIIAVLATLKQRGKRIGMFIIVVGLLAVLFPRINYEIEGYSIIDAMTERYSSRFNVLTSGEENRGNQWQVLSMENPLAIMFGLGVGKCSPENPNTTTPMPDAMLFRIFNEMGLVGLLLYLFFFYSNIKRAFNRKNEFMIALLLYAFLANYVNRVMFTAPMSIIPYTLIAIFNWNNLPVISKTKVKEK